VLVGEVLGAGISPQVFWVLGTAAVAVVALHVCLRYTITGKAMRACASNDQASLLAGINVANMRTLAFMISAALGALGGCVLSPITMTQYDMGTSLAIKASRRHPRRPRQQMAAVLAGLLVGLAEAFSVCYLPAAYKDAMAFAILLLVLFARPQGLFTGREVGSSGREF